MAKVPRKVGLVIAILFLFSGAMLSMRGSELSSDAMLGSIITTEKIVQLTNISREAVGVKTLKASRKLRLAAQKKARDMMQHQYFAHNSPGGKTPWDFMDEAGYQYEMAGENLAINFRSSETLEKGWMMSKDHQENILDTEYTEIGIGIAKGKFLGKKTSIVVQMFGRPPQGVSIAANIFDDMMETESIQSTLALLFIVTAALVLMLAYFQHQKGRFSSRDRRPHRRHYR